MDWVKAALLTGLLNIFLMNMVPDTFAADYGRGNACRRGDRLNIEDLDVSPTRSSRGHAFGPGKCAFGSMVTANARRKF